MSVTAIHAPFASLSGLSRAAENFILNYPHEARVAVMAALEAVASRFPAEFSSAKVMPDTLKSFNAKEGFSEPSVSISAAAGRLRVSRTTIYDWIERKRMIGWKVTRQGAIIPAEQIVGRGELVAGLQPLLRIIPDPRRAWSFLTTESHFFAGEPRRPIELLKTGEVMQVLDAARAYVNSFA